MEVSSPKTYILRGSRYSLPRIGLLEGNPCVVLTRRPQMAAPDCRICVLMYSSLKVAHVVF